ncbi:hypothetical protein [Streptomyces sp. NBC_00670]|uniref:hypothetical protein n=1 Tax=Streptomyces sp. NBC_00670 TaxID=2975804 RepID=UPI002E35040F|nr:hypothetical protein [Streptomyces sp. NBC_00670]
MSGDRYTLTALARDLDVGSRLLARRAALLAAAGYRRCRTLATTGRPGAPSVPRTPPAAAPSDRTPGAEGGTGGEGAPASAPPVMAPAKQAGKGRRAAATARARSGAVDTWLLAGLSAWVAWCFLRRPLAAGLHALAPDMAVLAPFAAAWWSVAAWLTAQHDKHRQAQQPAPADPAPADGQPDGAPTREAVQAAEQWLHHLVITRVLKAARQGFKGVHLNTLLTEPGIPATWRVGTLKAHLERLAIPVNRNLKLKGAPGPTYGVRADELAAALGMPLEQAVLAYAPVHPDSPLPAPERASEEGPAVPAAEGPGGPAGEGVQPAPSGGLLARLLGALTGPAARPSRTPDATPSPAASQPRPGGG